MIGKLVLSTTLVLASPVWAQEKARALVCPPSLSYCYYVEKPIKQRIDTEDAIKSLSKSTDCMEYNLRRGVSIQPCFAIALPTR